MSNGIGTLESTAIRQLHPVPPVYGRGGFLLDDQRRRSSRSQGDEGLSDTQNTTDATGLSLSPDKLAEALKNLRQDQAASAPERAYVAAGRAKGHDRSDSAVSTGLAAASPSQAADTAARDVHSAPRSQSSENRSEPGQTAPGDTEDSALAASQTGKTEHRSTERTFIGGGSDSGRGAEKHGAQTNPDQQLAEDEKAEVEDLKARDREVRTHEQAHMGASGGLAVGGASFQHERGPDGRMYAVAGEVQIDTSEGANPDETIAKAQRIKAAAMAPAQPSGQDRQVAAQAAQMEATARQEKASGKDENTAPGATQSLDKQDKSGEPDAQDMQASRRPSLLQHATQAYARARGETLPAPWGSGISFAV